MVRKCLFFMLLFISIVHFSLGEEIYSKDFYITPRVGFSTLTGMMGIELQYKHFAFDIGYGTGSKVKYTSTYGIKYYFNSYRSTPYIGLGGWTDYEEIITDKEWRTAIGFMLGYRWRWGKGFDANLGIGPAFSKGKKAFDPPLFEIAFGYSF